MSQQKTQEQIDNCQICKGRRWLYMQPGNTRSVCFECNASGEFQQADGTVDEAALDDWNTFTPQELLTNALRKVYSERVRQINQWGGAEHDDQHTPSVWLEILETRLEKVQAGTWADFELDKYREGLVELAAVAVAAIEQLDRLGEEQLAEHIRESRN